MTTDNILLLTTEFCHLCEQAESLLNDYCHQNGMSYKKLDIVDDEKLLEQFRTSIPVVCYHDGTICWPFDATELNQFMQQQ
ncbi:MAG TPA: glutaredoxin family protein [Aeromonadales bacterium]|nr:glutaredoxin family protein [Aeromonadales bacterium]